MKLTTILFSIFVYCVTAKRPDGTSEDLDDAWQDYKSTLGKIYSEDLENVRRLIWEENLQTIQEHNLQYDLGHTTYTMGLNQYSDLTFLEFKENMLGLSHSPHNITGETFLPPLNTGDVPNEVDWRKKGYVTPVKNQKSCGSCWAFSTTGALEGQHFRKTGKLVSLSEQQLVDCSGSFGNHGCNGGWPTRAYDYIKTFGIESESGYPYTAKDDMCRFQKEKMVAKCTGYQRLPPKNESVLKIAVAQEGPISVLIHVCKTFFQYKSGVYDDPTCANNILNHAVLAVGYGVSGGKDYWLVKNSWGPSWGTDGYVMMSRNKNSQCGIANFAVFPTV